ncbi:glycosyltransferase [Salinigranum salinum]|uniref:glycosyltransferase n=1 Tax=Salinigranum salinum TaxID=1364937 RepID=UPI001865055F|nr:glycosyltransferase [Salinigranum salinum]
MLDPSAFTPPYDHHLCTGLAAVGCDLTLLTTDADYFLWDDKTAYDRVEYFYGHTNGLYAGHDSLPGRTAVKGVEHVLDMARVLREIRSRDPDVVHFQWLPLPVVDRVYLRALARVAPLVFTVHDTTPFHGASTSRLQLLGARSVYDAFDRLIVHTRTSRDELVRQGVLASDVSVIPHGILEYPEPTAPASGGGVEEEDGVDEVLFFGTIKPYKNVDTLLEAFASLPPETREGTVLRIAGNPKVDVAPLKGLADSLGIASAVRWDLRFVPDVEVPELFAGADLVAFPYDDIDQSGALLTALQYEKPVLATDISGFAEVLTDGEHGFLVPPNDADALAGAMDRILSDPDLSARMSERVGDLAESIPTWTAIAAQTREVYRTVA